MIASKNAIDLIKRFEGFRAEAYNDQAGNATIGYGHLLHKGPITAEDEKKIWTEEHAEAQLALEVRLIEQHLASVLKVQVTQGQFDAIVAWTYNLGIGNLNEEKCSWLRELNAKNYGAVPGLLSLWNKVRDKGKLVESNGLTRRRQAEAELFKGVTV